MKQIHHAIHPLIKKRWSPRAFLPDVPDRAELFQLFEAARWAASSFNEQPWYFILARQDDEAFDRMVECLSEGNKKWAPKAPVLMLTVAKTFFERNGKDNRHAYHDLGLAMGNMSIQASSMDLYIHQMAGFDTEKARELFEIPKGYDPVAMVAIGYLGDPSTLPEDLQAKEGRKDRRVLENTVFHGSWGTPFPDSHGNGSS